MNILMNKNELEKDGVSMWMTNNALGLGFDKKARERKDKRRVNTEAFL